MISRRPIEWEVCLFKVLLEAYPTIKTNKLVMNLGNRIVEVENQLQFARSGFNAVT